MLAQTGGALADSGVSKLKPGEMSNTRHFKSRNGTSRTVQAPTLFSRLPESLQGRLKQQAVRRLFPTGSLIQQVGDGASGFWLIERGAVQLGVFRSNGEFRSIATLGEGDSYGELALMGKSRRVTDAVARVPSELLWIDGWRYEQAISQDPAILRDLLGAMALELQEVLGYLAGFRGGSARSRIASVIANAARHSGQSAIVITQAEIAGLAGVTRATAASVLRDLERQGAIRRCYGKVEVADLERLEEEGV